ncbi:cytidylyltransferase domain-containing protein [Facklamia sp. P12937]|uniref:cytidylyltransferase domain-containing protein n=1 Tax=Facklamia sp. P12937 TaxID=3421949 RepID=UPI003D1718BB
MSSIAIIPARSGSKGLPDKNIMNLKGKPVIAYTIEAALKSKCFGENVYVTTDSIEYAEISKQYGAKIILRDKNLSDDKASSYMVIEHAIKKIQSEGIAFDSFALLQPTSPLRTESNIVEAYKIFKEPFDFCVSVTKSDKSSKLIKSLNNQTMSNFNLNYKNYSRQKYEEYYPNGAIFIGKPEKYILKGDFFGDKSIAYIMPLNESIDLDTPEDFYQAINIISRKNSREEISIKVRKRIKEKLKYYDRGGEVLFLGHSVMDCYPYEKVSDKIISNFGISGACAKDISTYLINKMKTCNSYNYIFIMLGINDIKQGYLKEEFKFSLNNIIEFVKKYFSNSKIYIFKIMHNNVNINVNNTQIEEYNKAIYEISKLNNIHIIDWVNFYNSYGKVLYKYSEDGVHLSKEGYELLNSKIKTIIFQEGNYDV